MVSERPLWRSDLFDTGRSLRLMDNQTMKKQPYGALVFHQRVRSEKVFSHGLFVLGERNGFVVDPIEFCGQKTWTLFSDSTLHLPGGARASFCSQGVTHGVNDGAITSESHLVFGENDWAIIHLSSGLEVVVCFRDTTAGALGGGSFLALSRALESPAMRALVLSFALHSAFIFFAGLTSDPVEMYTYRQQQMRWVEMVSNVEERAEEEKPDEVPVIEDTDDVIIDDALKDQDRPKIDDTPSTMANLDKVEKPVGLQAALSGAKLHDMESLFGSTAGLGNALDFMPETADGDAFGTGAGFAAGLSGMGFGGGGGGGGGFGSGIGGIGGGGGGKAGNTKVAGPRKSTVKQKTKLAMDPPKQGAFCKESNIREVVQKRANALRNCYEQQLLANPDLSGKIIVFWKIGLDGKVTDASIKSTTMNNARVESCLTQTVRRLRFDKPDGGICVVEFPFIFTSAQ